MIHSFDDFEFDAGKLELRRTGRPVKADALLLRILAVLVQRPGDLITKQEIVSQVWDDRAISDNALSVSMARLRKLLGHQRSGREVVVNVHGRGYRFVRAVTPRDSQLGPVLSAPSLGRVGMPFVGRTFALQTVRGALEEAHAGSGSFCVLSGEAGIGKTRAVEIAAREAAAAVGLWRGVVAAKQGDAPALWPLVQLLRELCARSSLDLTGRPLSPCSPRIWHRCCRSWPPSMLATHPPPLAAGSRRTTPPRATASVTPWRACCARPQLPSLAS
jgi:DNA-binding winged helix-turn-helix (wHTH) protein